VGTSLYAYEYQYDKVGNRSYLNYNNEHTYYTYNEANELTLEVPLGGDLVYYTYDGRGNQVQRKVLGGDTTYFSYNSRDLVTAIDSTASGFTTNYFEYNALGQRTKMVDSTGTTHFVWDGIRITHEHDGAGNITRRYTYGHSPIVGVSDLIDLQDLEAGGDPHYFYHFDQVGGIHRLTAADETTAQTLEFSPYGRMLVETGTAPNRFSFPATYVSLSDSPSLLLSPGRVYCSSVGRFAARDTEEPTATYVAFGSNPNRVPDPSGRRARPDVPVVEVPVKPPALSPPPPLSLDDSHAPKGEETFESCVCHCFLDVGAKFLGFEAGFTLAEKIPLRIWRKMVKSLKPIAGAYHATELMLCLLSCAIEHPPELSEEGRQWWERDRLQRERDELLRQDIRERFPDVDDPTLNNLSEEDLFKVLRGAEEAEKNRLERQLRY
jgi:hypothetical protein